MVTSEIIDYIKGELANGRTREAIHADLVAEGGWIEEDLSEAFKIALSVQNPVSPKITTKDIISPVILLNKPGA